MKAGWHREQLRTVTTKIGSGATPLGGDAAYKAVGISLIRSLNVHDTGFRFKNLAFIDDDQADRLANVIVEPDDVLLNITGASIARCCVVPDDVLPARVNQHVSILRPIKERILPKLLYYMLTSKTYKDSLLNAGESGGSTRQALTKSQLKDFWIECPRSISEQQRIVAILDEAFDGIATAKANTEKNLQNARELFESRLQLVFAQQGEGWVEKTFEELIESNVIGLTKNSREQGEDKEWPYVKMNNITRDNRFDFSKFVNVDATEADVQKYRLKNGDFLFNTRNSFELVGKSCIYDGDSENVVLYNNNIMRIRFVKSVDARVILFAFSFKPVVEALNALKSGTTNVSAIYYRDLKSLAIPVPPPPSHKKIAAALEGVRAETQRLESIYKQKLTALDELKQSLLHRAFNGDL